MKMERIRTARRIYWTVRPNRMSKSDGQDSLFRY